MGLTDKILSQVVKEVRRGLVGDPLGSNLIKKRVAVGNKGKSGGLRSIIVYQTPRENLFCVYLFAKSETENISQRQLKQLKLLAEHLLKLTDKQIQKAIELNALEELIDEEESQTK